MLYKFNILSVRAEPKARGQWCSGPEFEPLLNDITGNHPRALREPSPAQRRGKMLLYRFVLSNGGVPGLESRRVGGGSDARFN